MNQNYDSIVKVLLMGNPSVGKSSFLLRFSEDSYDEKLLTTIGVDFKTKILKINDKNVYVQVWDTAGQERYRTISSGYYRGAHGAIILYDVTDRTSFIAIDEWINDITFINKNITLLLIGTKCDQERKREVNYEEGLEKSRQLKCNFFEVSSRTGLGVNDAFTDIITTIVNMYSHNNSPAGISLHRDYANPPIKFKNTFYCCPI